MLTQSQEPKDMWKSSPSQKKTTKKWYVKDQPGTENKFTKMVNHFAELCKNNQYRDKETNWSDRSINTPASKQQFV